MGEGVESEGYMNESKSKSYWEAKWERMHHMPSWLGAKFTKEDYVDYCMKEYVKEEMKDER